MLTENRGFTNYYGWLKNHFYLICCGAKNQSPHSLDVNSFFIDPKHKQWRSFFS